MIKAWMQLGGRFIAGACCVLLVWLPLNPTMLRLAIGALGIVVEEDQELGDVVSYKLDYWLSTSTNSKPVTLLILTGWLVLVGTFALQVSRGDTLWDASWTVIQGVGFDWTFIGDEEHAGLLPRIVAFMTSLGGMLVTALLLGIVGESISEKVDEMKKGKSKVRRCRLTSG